MENGDKRFKSVILLFFGAIFLYWGLNHYKIIFNVLGIIFGFIFPFVLGGCIAFLLNIPMKFIERVLFKIFTTKKHKPKLKIIRLISLILTLILVFSIIIGALFIIIPQLSRTILAIKDQIPSFVADCQNLLQKLSLKMPDLFKVVNEFSFDWGKITNNLTSLLGEWGSVAVSSSISLATSVFSGIVNFFLSFVFSLYVLAGKEKLGKNAKSTMRAFLPKEIYKKTLDIFSLIDSTFSSFFSGQCLEAVIIGVMFFIGMSLLRFPFTPLISVLIAVTSLVPVFGTFVACILGAFLILVQSPIQAVWFVVFFLVVQQIEGNFIYPRVVGNSVGLPPIFVLIGVTLGGGIFGIIGMLIFIPITSVVYTLLKDLIHKRLGNNNCENQDINNKYLEKDKPNKIQENKKL